MRADPLEGFRILELGNSEAAGICTLLASDFGADVTRIIFSEKEITEDFCMDYRICDRGKEKVVLNPADEKDHAIFRKMLSSAHAIVNGMQKAEMEAAGIGDEEIERSNPAAPLITVTPYGTAGPYADHRWSEACVQAESGFVSTTGPENGDPVRCGGDIATFAGAMNACAALLMSIYDSLNGHSGRRADVSLMDSLVFALENQLSLSIRTGNVPKPRGNHYALSAPVGNFPCKDGKEIMISVATEAQWEAFCSVLHHEEWIQVPEYLNVSRRLVNVDRLSSDVAAAFMEYDSDELMDILQSRSCIYGRINTFPDVVIHPQVKAHNLFHEVTDPEGNKIMVPANPVYTSSGKTNCWNIN